MSQEVVVVVRCDLCQVAADGDVSVEKDVLVQFGRVRREIDLCDRCKSNAEDVTRYLLDAGRKPGAVPTAQPGRPVTKRATSYANGEPLKCPFSDCVQGPYANIDSARKHLRDAHSLGLGEARERWPELFVQGRPPVQEQRQYACPECKAKGVTKKCRGKQGLAVHRFRAHGVEGQSVEAQRKRKVSAA